MAEHEAGPDLDRLIAERVMGWRWGQQGAGDYMGWDGAPAGSRAKGSYHHQSFRPSSDMADAWLVLERFTSRDPLWEWDLSFAATHGWFTCWINNGGTSVEATADTAPLAICRAALVATT
jgi:hypothetical protein